MKDVIIIGAGPCVSRQLSNANATLRPALSLKKALLYTPFICIQQICNFSVRLSY